jgi:hypothetical protein
MIDSIRIIEVLHQNMLERQEAAKYRYSNTAAPDCGGPGSLLHYDV